MNDWFDGDPWLFVLIIVVAAGWYGAVIYFEHPDIGIVQPRSFASSSSEAISTRPASRKEREAYDQT